VALDPSARPRPKLTVEVRGHVPRRPTMIALQARAKQNATHASLDPATVKTGSHSPRPP
jgi:hypothetical protein